MSKILVTGGAGFVGSNLCETLIEQEHEVVSLDNYFTGSVDNHVDRVRYIAGMTEDIKTHLSNFKPDIIYHLGEYSRVEQSFDDINAVFSFNQTGTFKVLEYARETGSKLVYAGSSTKYAENTGKYIISPYAYTKAANTELVKNYGKWFGLDYAITYFYNVYGNREIQTGKYATLIAKYKELMKQGKKLPVVLPGVQTRNFTYIDDIVDALIRIGKDGSGDEYGIGNPNEYTIEEVAKLFGGEITYLDERKGNRMSAPVITEKTRELGWEPKTQLPDYINELKLRGWT